MGTRTATISARLRTQSSLNVNAVLISFQDALTSNVAPLRLSGMVMAMNHVWGVNLSLLLVVNVN